MPALLCPWESPSFIFISSNVPKLLYYSHIPALVVTLVVCGFIYFKDRKSLISKLLLAIAISFSLWVVIDMLLWATNRPDITMFFWSLQILAEVLVYFFSFYLSVAYATKNDLPNRAKWLISILLVSFIALIPTKLNLLGINLADCTAIESPVVVYGSYILEIFFTVSLIIVLAREFIHSRLDIEKRKELRTFSIGLVLFLSAFTFGNIIGSFTSNWDISQYGLFGMPVFIAFLSYTAVRYKMFHIKEAGATALVFSLWGLIFSLLFLEASLVARIITVATLAAVTVFGILLIRSVRQEVKRREEIAQMAESLEIANARLQELDKQKTDFLSIASHQLRTPLSILKGYIELIKDGGYGKVTKETVEVLQNMDDSNEHLVKLVDEFLNISRIEQGRTKYNFADFDMTHLIDGIVFELAKRAEDKGLSLEWLIKEPLNLCGDEEKIRHVIFNFVDNAIKYTPTGVIKIGLIFDDGGVKVTVNDNGFGFGKIDEANFFQKFYRGDNVKNTNVTGTGLGLFVCRRFIEAHGGKVWAHSPGLGKGSEFGFWLPLKSDRPAIQ